MLLLDIVPDIFLPTLHESSLVLLDGGRIDAFRVQSALTSLVCRVIEVWMTIVDV